MHPLAANGWCVWVTGLPGSGKSVVAEALLEKLKAKGIHARIVSSDMLRKVVTPEPTYSQEERDMVYNALVLVARLITLEGYNVIIDATGNLKRYRNQARKRIPRFIEAYIRCPLEICIERETKRGKTFRAPKQIYRKALEGKAPTVPGIGAPYEEPQHPEVVVDSDMLNPDQCAQKILEAIKNHFLSKA